MGAGGRTFRHKSHGLAGKGRVGCNSDATLLPSVPRVPFLTPPAICSLSLVGTQLRCPFQAHLPVPQRFRLVHCLPSTYHSQVLL